MISNIVQYQNGNVTVTLDKSNGTKERFTEDDEFHPEFAESIDVTITYRCDNNCRFCYADCTPSGNHADLFSKYVTEIFIPSIKPYTELALNGNDLSHPQLEGFLSLLKENNIIANLTVHQNHFMRNLDLLHKWSKNNLINGLGISLVNPSHMGFIQEVNRFPNSVIHCIAGVLSEDDIKKLSNNNLKLLILGYKNKGRGGEYFSNNSSEVSKRIYWLRESIDRFIKDNLFNVISFDNLAVEQLDIKNTISDSEWNRYYMGDDGSFTFFVDLVNMKYSRDSMNPDIRYISNKNAIQMFQSIRI